jgi:Ser/Thr protein kinase RdoA (MazF antagonist)
MPNISPGSHELNQLFHVYSPTELVEVERNDAAYANDVYNLTDTAGQEFVMRILKIQDPKTVNLEARMQTMLSAIGIRTPQYLAFGENNFVGEEGGHHFTLSKRIEGRTPTDVTPELVTDFGATLARIHNCLQGLVVPPNKMQWFDPKIAQQDLDTYNGPLKAKLTTLVDKGKELLSLGLPEAVIHGDLWLSNTFAEGNKVTAVFDFETAQNTARIIDLARTYTSMRRETSIPAQQIIDLLISGYDSVASESLTQAESDNFRLAIAYVAGVVAAWHAANGTRYTGPYIEIGEEVLSSS